MMTIKAWTILVLYRKSSLGRNYVKTGFSTQVGWKGESCGVSQFSVWLQYKDQNKWFFVDPASLKYLCLICSCSLQMRIV